MKRSKFLKNLVIGVLSVAVAPTILEALPSSEVSPVVDGADLFLYIGNECIGKVESHTLDINSDNLIGSTTYESSGWNTRMEAWEGQEWSIIWEGEIL